MRARTGLDADKTQDESPIEDLVSRRQQDAAALTPSTDSQYRDSQVPNDESDENRAILLRKKLAALKKPERHAGPAGDTTQDGAVEENRAAALRQKLAALRPNTLSPTADSDSDRGGEVSRLRSPLTGPAEGLTPSGDRSSSTPAEETPRSRLAALSRKPSTDGGLPPTDRSPAPPRPRSAVRRASSLSGRSRSRSPVKGRIATLRLKPRRVSQSPDPLGRWRSVEDVLGSPAGPVDLQGDDVSWEPQRHC